MWRRADWSPDGKTLAIVRDVGGKQRLEYPVGHVLSTKQTAGSATCGFRLKADKIAFLDHTTHADDRGVVSVVDLAGQKKVLSTGWESEEGLAWSPNGSEVWFSAAQAGLQRRIYAVDLSGYLRPAFRAPGGVTLQDISSDGRVLLTRDEQRAGIMGMANGADAGAGCFLAGLVAAGGYFARRQHLALRRTGRGGRTDLYGRRA